MNEYLYLLLLIPILILAFLVGCSPVIDPPDPPEPELYRIEVTPHKADIQAGTSITLFVTGYSIEGEEVMMDTMKVKWSKCCPSGDLEPITGYTTTFTSLRSSSGIMMIYCDYEEFRDTARINIIGR